jgi:hypothetical protein
MINKYFSSFFIFFVLIFLLPFNIGAADFGFLFNQYMVGSSNPNDDKNSFEYQADLLPRFSLLIGDTGDFIVSGGITLGLSNQPDREFNIIPELLRTEFSIRFNNNRLKLGRVQFSDPIGIIASGLFDGFHFSNSSTLGTFSLGAWYTGLLYKKNINIILTQSEFEAQAVPFDFGDFINTYFAPKRLLASFDWEHPSIAELFSINASLIGQFDLSDYKDKFHSQYLSLKIALPINKFLFEIGGSLGISEVFPAKETNISFACNFGIFWTPPVSFNSRLLFTGYYASGMSGDLTPFAPFTTRYFGNIFQVELKGLTILSLNYSVRLTNSFGASFSASHFIRNDLETFSGYPAGSDGYFLGTELFARFIWSPYSDLQFNAGGGAFLPFLGDAGPNENLKWRIDLAAIFAIY